MKRLFGKKSKKSPKPSPKHVFPGIPANIAVGPLGFRAELDIDPDDEGSNRSSRIVFQDNSGEGEEPPAPEVSTSGVAVVGTGHRSDPARNATDTGEGEGGRKLAEASKVPEREYKDTALRTATILPDVPKEATGGFSPLDSLKVVLRTIAAVYANNQETIAIGNRTENLLSRIVALEEHFYSRPDDVEEQRRRDKVIRDFGRTEGQLRSLSEKPELPGHAQYSEEVHGLLEDLREIIFDYQMVQQKEIYDQRRKLIKPGQRIFRSR
ncbi:hypothetical protein BDM02DRAFT_1414393 [Thelephora ganbajun]|uniref:Uncharacterized protein n=1 Tax=Thelephora ganbajun TaxID=370292 RepID=A0ACB6Z1G0_THEGA|nr:hypothetical protein BDM02DRAFT_1414393 [Thelephora ganbajun]